MAGAGADLVDWLIIFRCNPITDTYKILAADPLRNLERKAVIAGPHPSIGPVAKWQGVRGPVHGSLAATSEKRICLSPNLSQSPSKVPGLGDFIRQELHANHRQVTKYMSKHQILGGASWRRQKEIRPKSYLDF